MGFIGDVFNIVGGFFDAATMGIKLGLHFVMDPVISFAGRIVPGLDDILEDGLNFITEVTFAIGNTVKEAISIPVNLADAVISGDDIGEVFSTEVSEFFNTLTNEVKDVAESGFEFGSSIVELPTKIIPGINTEFGEKQDGKIGDFKQKGLGGNCWLLGPMLAGSKNKKHAEIIAKSIHKADNGWTVKFPGMDSAVHVSYDDLTTFDINPLVPLTQIASTGDTDVKIIEIAVSKYLIEQGKYTFGSGISQGFKLLFNENITEIKGSKEEILKKLAKLKSGPEGNNFSMALHLKPGTLDLLTWISPSDHIVGVGAIYPEKNQIEILDPMDSGKVNIIPLDKFAEQIANGNIGIILAD